MPVPVIILLCVLGALALLCAVCAVRAARMKKTLPDTPAAVSWTDKEAEKYAEDLSEMVKIPTVSRKQEEDYPDFLVFQKKLEELFPLFFARAENHDISGNILRKLPGKDPKRGALLLMGHQDVVPAEGQSGWEKPPFSGEIENGCVWGRGAMDCKSTVCCELEAIEELLKEGFTFNEDLWFFSARNEENSGGGSDAAAAWLKEQGIRLNVVLDEGGAVVMDMFPGLKAPASGVGVVEKGYVNLKFTARSAGGHASTPPKNSPIARLSKFVAEAEKKNVFKQKMVSPVPEMFAAISPYLPFYFRFVLGNLWLFQPLVLKIMKGNAETGAMIRSTVALTKLEGSDTINVIPNKAVAGFSVRVAPWDSPDDLIAQIKARAGEHAEVTSEYTVYPSPVSPTDRRLNAGGAAS